MNIIGNALDFQEEEMNGKSGIALKEFLEEKLREKQVPLSNGVHLQLVGLVEEGRLTVRQNSQLHLRWELGSYVTGR
jgi:hypothetical protein